MCHLALVALPIRALFIPMGFQSIRCDPNVLFDAIEEVKKQKEEEKVDDEDRPEFFYFQEKTSKVKALDEINPEEDEIQRKELIGDIRPDMTDKEADEADAMVKQHIKATLGSGEDKMATEILGITNFGEEEDKVDEDKISILPVSFDLNFRSIVTKGLEVKGFIPVNVPRRPGQQGLTLEKYEFIPNFEDCAIESPFKEAFVEYVSVCSALAEKVTQISDKVSPLQMNGYKLADEALVKKYTDVPEDNYRLMKVFKELIDLKVDPNLNSIEDHKKEPIVLENVIKEIIEKKENNLSTDLISSIVTNERFIRPFIDILLENSNDKTQIKVLEISPNKNVVANQLIEKIKASCIGLIAVDYMIANPSPSTIPEETKALNLKTLEWDFNTNQFIKDIQFLDLLVYRMTNSIANSWKIEDQIQSLSDALKVCLIIWF